MVEPKSLLRTVEEVLKFQGTTLRPGDILIFRTGWLEWYDSTDSEATHKQLCLDVEPGEHHFIGLASEPSLVEWIWNNQAVGISLHLEAPHHHRIIDG